MLAIRSEVIEEEHSGGVVASANSEQIVCAAVLAKRSEYYRNIMYDGLRRTAYRRCTEAARK